MPSHFWIFYVLFNIPSYSWGFFQVLLSWFSILGFLNGCQVQVMSPKKWSDSREYAKTKLQGATKNIYNGFMFVSEWKFGLGKGEPTYHKTETPPEFQHLDLLLFSMIFQEQHLLLCNNASFILANGVWLKPLNSNPTWISTWRSQRI
jgi:hypothetical protein